MTFRNKLSQIWFNIHRDLFPLIEDQIGELSPLHKRLVSVLELIRFEQHIADSSWNLGRPSYNRRAFARAFVAKVVFKLTTTKQLVEYLKKDKQLLAICGFDANKKVASLSTFSRAFQEFTDSQLPDRVHQALIKEMYEGEIVGSVIKDSTPINARERPLKKKKSKKRIRTTRRKGELNRRQKQLQEVNHNIMIDALPKNCDIGMKKSGKGIHLAWIGYKLHIATDIHCVPLAAIVTSASLNDCEVAIPLAAKCNQVVTNLYDVMDAAYDHPEIKEHSLSLNHVPIIDKCPPNKAKKIEIESEKLAKKTLNFKTPEDLRYLERFPTERVNSLYKNHYGGKSLTYRGHSKVFCEVMFGILALAGTQLLNLM
jgi:hypothetical protein